MEENRKKILLNVKEKSSHYHKHDCQKTGDKEFGTVVYHLLPLSTLMSSINILQNRKENGSFHSFYTFNT